MVGVEPAAVDSSWPWWGKALVIGGTVIAVGILAYVIYDNVSVNGSSDSSENSAQKLGISVGGQNNNVTINYNSNRTSENNEGNSTIRN